jgi:SAM-dependent methyltransferase
VQYCIQSSMAVNLTTKTVPLKLRVLPLLKPRGWDSFIRSVKQNGKLLDVGCGNNSPWRVKRQRPDIVYVGLDIGDYNQKADAHRWADEYLVVQPNKFAPTIQSLADRFDAVICSHNLEHCEEPRAVLRATLKALRRGGRLYLSFPCEESVAFPHRDPLNFFDDPTHTEPPNFSDTMATIRAEGFQVDFVAKRYRPALPFLLGLTLEPCARLRKKNMLAGSTWALYGFETVIWASRPA